MEIYNTIQFSNRYFIYVHGSTACFTSSSGGNMVDGVLPAFIFLRPKMMEYLFDSVVRTGRASIRNNVLVDSNLYEFSRRRHG